MSLINWTIGVSVFNILVIILLVGIGDYYSSDVAIGGTDLDDYNLSAVTDLQASGSSVTASDFSMIDKLFFSLSGLPFYISFLLSIPTLIYVVIVILYIRGVN